MIELMMRITHVGRIRYEYDHEASQLNVWWPGWRFEESRGGAWTALGCGPGPHLIVTDETKTLREMLDECVTIAGRYSLQDLIDIASGMQTPLRDITWETRCRSA